MKNYKLYCSIIIAFAVVLAITSEWGDSIIVDEVPHIGAGYSYLVKGDMRLNPEHPPLAKDVAAIPLVFLDLKKDAFQTKFWQSDLNGQWEFGRNLIFNSGNDADLIRHAAKLPMIIFFILAGILVAKWARKLYGDSAGLMALFLFSFSPTILTHARFVTTDVPALFGVILASYFFFNYLREPNWKNLIIAGLTFGVALICKFSTFIIAPFLGLMAVIWGLFQLKKSFSLRIINGIKYGIISVLIFLIGLIFVVWPVYYFHTFNYPPERQQHDTQILLGSFGNRLLAEPVIWMSDKPIIRALGQYGLGLLMVVQRSTGGNTTYFLGETSGSGWHYYFPVVYFLKEPLAWWGLVLIAVLFFVFKKRRNSENPGSFSSNNLEEIGMLVWLVIYWATSIKSNLNIGVRHLLPVFPFTIILVSGQISRIIDKARRVRKENQNLFGVILPAVIILFFGWYFLENMMVYPYYLSYFNQVAGGPSGGYKYVVDSNLDWGQDLVRLSNYVNNNNIKKIELDYFGWADPYYYLKDRYIWMTSTKYLNLEDFKRRNLSDGWLAVSATFLEGSEGTPDKPNPINYKNWLQAQTPVTVIGHSIFVYHLK